MKIQRAILAVGALVALQFPASAQDFYLDMAVHYGNNVVSTLSNDIHSAGIRSTMRQQQRISRQRTNRQAPPRQTSKTSSPQRTAPKPVPTSGPSRPPAVVSPVLTFGSSPEVSARVIDDMVATLSGALVQGVSEKEFRQALESGQLQRKFTKLLKDVDYSDRNLADVMAAQLVISWQIGTQTPFYGDAATFRPVRDKMRQALHSQAWVGRLSDQQKQQLGETIALGTMLILERYEHAISTKNMGEKQQASQDAVDYVKTSLGVDLRTLTLTPNGFIPR